jgi:MOSC domain-containing protein
MASEEVAQAFVGFAGLMGDRAFAFVRTSGPKGFPWHTGREQEDLVLFRPHFREGGATQRAGHAVTLRFSERSLYDCRPVSLFGNASARGLGDELAMPIDRRRFRANADWVEDRPYRENQLVRRTLQIGERLHLAVLERDPRCKMITIDPETGQTEPRVLRHVTKAHDGMAGVYAAVLVEGVVRQGDPIHLI